MEQLARETQATLELPRTVQRIMVPLDGSTFGEHALPIALTIAGRLGARVELVHVSTPVPHLRDPEARGQTDAYLRDLIRRLPTVPDVTVETGLLDGPVGQALIEHAALTGANLVVMATHGRGGLARGWLGSVADELARGVGRPVLLVRPTWETLALRQAAPLRRILPGHNARDVVRAAAGDPPLRPRRSGAGGVRGHHGRSAGRQGPPGGE